MLSRLKLFSLFSLTLLFSAGLPTLSASWKLAPPPVQAQTSEARETEGQSQQAKNLLQQALTITRESKDSQLEERIRQILSDVEKSSISPQKAEANQLLIQGWQYAEDANFQAALRSFKKALNIYQNLGERQGESETLIRMAWVYFQLGETKRALDLYQQGLQIAREIGKPFLQSLALRNMGNSYLRLRQEEQAIEAFQEALDISRKARDLAEEARTLHDLTFFYRRKGQYQLAIQTYQQALTVFRDRDELYGQEHILINLGDVYVILNQYREATAAYQQSLIIARKLSDRRIERAVLGRIGNLLVKQEQPELAIVFYKQAVNVTETIRKDIRDLPLKLQESYTETVAGTYRRLADLLLQQDRILEAQQVLDLLKVQELDDYLAGVWRQAKTEKGVPNLPPEQQINDGIDEILTKAVELGRELTQFNRLGVV